MDKTNASRQKRWRDKRRAGWWRLLYMVAALRPIVECLHQRVPPDREDIKRLLRQYEKSRKLFKLYKVDLHDNIQH